MLQFISIPNTGNGARREEDLIYLLFLLPEVACLKQALLSFQKTYLIWYFNSHGDPFRKSSLVVLKVKTACVTS